MDEALNNQREKLFQAMGIIALATRAVQRLDSQDSHTVDIWTALDGAYALLDRVSAKLQDCATMLGD